MEVSGVLLVRRRYTCWGGSKDSSYILCRSEPTQYTLNQLKTHWHSTLCGQHSTRSTLDPNPKREHTSREASRCATMRRMIQEGTVDRRV